MSGIDQKTIALLENGEVTRQDLIQTELTKYLEKSANKDNFILKEEGRTEIIKMLKIYPKDYQF